MRWSVSLIVAGTIAFLLIAAGFVFVQVTRKQIADLAAVAKQDLLKQKAAGELPDEWAGADIENLQPSDMDLEVPQQLVVRIRIADLLAGFWYVWVILVFAACFAVAALAARGRQA